MADIDKEQCIMEFWIFSYNRGKFLENCVKSLEDCLPDNVHISVFDDCSDDPHTQEVLKNIERKHRIVRPSETALQSKHGGLYGNLQALITNENIQHKSDFICCIQDDMQAVRTVNTEEILAAQKLFNDRPKLGFIQPAFMRGCNKKHDAKRTRFDSSVNGYYVDRYNKSAGAFYSDIFISSISRLKETKWSFSSRESSNDKNARNTLEQMIYLRNPFVAWLPNVPAFRGKRQTLAMKIAQKQQQSDFHALHIMSPIIAKKFIERNIDELPYAEDFLNPVNGNLKKPWTYYPLQGRRWLKRLNQAELILRKIKR